MLLACLAALLLVSCNHSENRESRSVPVVSTGGFTAPGTPLPRAGDEIMVCGRLFHTGAPVVLWTDPGGYDAYRTDRRFAPFEEADWESTQKAVKGIGSPNRYNMRYSDAPRGGGGV